MKKTVKNLILILLMGITLLILTGCGGNKLIVEKEVEDETYGKYTEKSVIIFEDDKVSKINSTLECENEDIATQLYSAFNWSKSMATGGELDGLNIKQEKNKLLIEMDAKTFANQSGVTEESMTKETMKKALEENGYTVK